MNIALIKGYVAIAGEEQGYRPLPYRRILLNDTVNGPGTPAVQTAWLPTPHQMELLINGAAVLATTLGNGVVPISLDVEPGPHQAVETTNEVLELNIDLGPLAANPAEMMWSPTPAQAAAMVRGATVLLRVTRHEMPPEGTQ